MDERVEYHFKKDGSTIGRVSGRSRSWQKGDVRTYPKGEFAHVSPRHYEMRPLTPAEEAAPKGNPAPARHYETSGSWKTFYEGGREVGKAQCSKEEAEAWTRGEKTLGEIR